MPRLPQGHGQLGAVGLLEIGHIAHVINVGVAANHTHGREPPRFPKASLQVFPLIVQTGVQENTMAVVQLVKGMSSQLFSTQVFPLTCSNSIAIPSLSYNFTFLPPYLFPYRNRPVGGRVSLSRRRFTRR